MSNVDRRLPDPTPVLPLLGALGLGESAPKTARPKPRARAPQPPRIGQTLVDMGAISPATLLKALAMQQREKVRLGEIMLAQGWVSEAVLLRALSLRHGIGLVDLAHRPTDPDLVRLLPCDVALRTHSVPWMQMGEVLVIATAYPEERDSVRAALNATLNAAAPEQTAQKVIFALAPAALIEEVIAQIHGPEMARTAESLTPYAQSCRAWRKGPYVLGALMLGALMALMLWPMAFVKAATVLALLVLAANTALKGMVLKSHLDLDPHPFVTRRETAPMARLPRVSLMVPLFKEPRIAGPLVQRMARLDYPAELLDILLIVEEDDLETLAALKTAPLPPSFRIIRVPDGHPRTKPRAMNYALNFAKGEIIGVYDAEDAPSADQIRRVVQRFDQVPAHVACLQGRLDFYNPRQNWISRCFAIEYATWFRVVLPGLRRLGMLMPLGGTTLFFRRDLLVKLGGWDAYNVTEDADLGVRLARAGYSTEIIDVTTDEEANSAAWPWIKQRSRWIKGYLLTWAVHNRTPLRLWKELGTRQWLGFQMLFLGTLLAPLLSPFLWGIGVALFGVYHPLISELPRAMVWGIGALVMFSTVLTLSISVFACRAPHLQFLRPWVLLNLIYVTLMSAATAKALAETLVRPFYWDKTDHGHFGGDAHGIAPKTPPLSASNIRALGPVLPDGRSPRLPFQILSPAPLRTEKSPNIRPLVAEAAPHLGGKSGSKLSRLKTVSAN